MSVYVDKSKNSFGRMIMSHMIADSLNELLEMATKIGLKEKWLQRDVHENYHFDICQSKKKLAIENGAIELDRKEFVEVLRRNRR